MRIILFLLLFSFGLYGQGIEPSALMPASFENAVLKAKIKVFDDWTQDTVYYFVHDSIVSQMSPDSIYLKTATAPNPDTIYLRDGSGFVLIPKGGAGTVTSVGLATGTTGTDVNVSGSPITGAGTITLNIPTASATNRGVLSSADWTTFNNKVGGSGVATRIAFWDSANSLSSNTNLFWHNTENRLYLGHSSGSLGRLNIQGREGVGQDMAINFRNTGGWVNSYIKTYNSTSPVSRGIIIGGYTNSSEENDVLSINPYLATGFVGINTPYPLAKLHATMPYTTTTNDGIRVDNETGQTALFQINNEGDAVIRTTTGHLSIGRFGTGSPNRIVDNNPSAALHLYGDGGVGEIDLIRLEKRDGFGATKLSQHYTTGSNWGLYITNALNGNKIANFNASNQRVNIGGANAPESTLHVQGDFRVDTRTGTGTTLTMWDANGRAVNGTIGTGLSITGGALTNTVTNTDNQTLSFTAPNLSISGGNSVNLSSINTDNQTLSVSGADLTISGGNTVTLPTGTTYTAGTGIDLTGNVITNTGDLSNTNELQTISKSGSTVTLSNGGGSFTDEVGPTYTAGSGISISGGNVISNTGDLSATNELITSVTSGLFGTTGQSITITEAGVSRAGLITNMDGATVSTNGNQGLVPRPLIANRLQFLRGDGTWANPQLGMQSWNIGINNGSYTSVVDGQDVSFNAGSGMTLTKSGSVITFASTSSGFNNVISKSGNTVNLTGSPASSFNIASTTPNNNEVLTWNGTNWVGAARNLSYGTKSGARVPLDISNGVGVNIDEAVGIRVNRTSSNVISIENLMSQYGQLHTTGNISGATFDGTYRKMALNVATSNGMTVSTSNNNITIPATGTYEISYHGNVQYNTDWLNVCYLQVFSNGSSLGYISETRARNLHNSIENNTLYSRTFIIDLNANAVIDLRYQRFGGTATTVNFFSPILSVKRLK
jgi:hypothetical protein